jgi:hypothetical protein
MSAWRVLVRRLYELGGEGTRDQFDDFSMSAGSSNWAVERAKALGLIELVDKRRQRPRWRLTELGRRYCEGEAELRHAPRITGGKAADYIAASWLSCLK